MVCLSIFNRARTREVYRYPLERLKDLKDRYLRIGFMSLSLISIPSD